MWHVWHMFYDMVPESQEAIEEMGAFARRHIGKKTIHPVFKTYRVDDPLERLLA